MQSIAFWDDAIKIESQDVEKTKSEVMELLQGAFMDTIPNPIDMHVTNWTHNPYSYGSYSALPIGFTNGMWEELRKNVDRLYFSGEHTAEKFHATVHGAFETGKLTANKVLKEIQATHQMESVPQLETNVMSLASMGTFLSHRLVAYSFGFVVCVKGIYQ